MQRADQAIPLRQLKNSTSLLQLSKDAVDTNEPALKDDDVRIHFQHARLRYFIRLQI